MIDAYKVPALNRLNRIEGQIRGLKKMVENEEYCIDVITQALAIKRALSAVEGLILKNHLSTHVLHQIKHGDEKKAVDELISVYKLSKKE